MLKVKCNDKMFFEISYYWASVLFTIKSTKWVFHWIYLILHRSWWTLLKKKNWYRETKEIICSYSMLLSQACMSHHAMRLPAFLVGCFRCVMLVTVNEALSRFAWSTHLLFQRSSSMGSPLCLFLATAPHSGKKSCGWVTHQILRSHHIRWMCSSSYPSAFASSCLIILDFLYWYTVSLLPFKTLQLAGWCDVNCFSSSHLQ